MDFYPDPHLPIEQELEEELSDMDFRDIVRLVQFMRNERDDLNSKIKAFLETFKVGVSGGAPSHPKTMWITAWRQDEIVSSIPSQKAKFDALLALWEAVNQDK